MPCDLKQYGANWPLFSAEIRFNRARSICECTGECGLHRGRRCQESHHKPAQWARGKIRLTVAHLCQCHPPCTIPNHVKAMCQRCHLRLDRYLHAKHRRQRATRQF